MPPPSPWAQGRDHSSLQSAIDEASPGDLIVVSDGIYHENVDLNKPLTLRGMGSKERPVLDAGGKGPAITISADGVAIERVRGHQLLRLRNIGPFR